jgi:Xaa-Pro aminopeptidase
MLESGRMRKAALVPLVSALLFAPAVVRAGPLQDDLRARRARVMERLGPDAIAIFWSAPTRVYSRDVDYEYRQDSNLLYLTGIDQEETMLVLMPGNATRREILFIREADARREHWVGHSLTPAEATAQSAIETVMRTPQFEPFVAAMFSKRGMRGDGNEYSRFFQALADSRARLALVVEPQTDLSSPPGPAAEFAGRLRDRFFGFSVQDATPILHELRQIKSAYEQDVLRKSVAISSEAHREGMQTAVPGAYEYEVEAAIEAVYLRSGAMSWGYPSIVGSGPNATILHYSRSSRKMEPGDLLLVDAAANYQGYTGDITRTYPVNGGHPGCVRRRAACRSCEAGAVERVGPAVQDVGHPRRHALDRHRRARRGHRSASRTGHDVRHRTWNLHPRGGAGEPVEDARTPGLHREGPSIRREVQECGGPDRRFVPAHRVRARTPVVQRAAYD